MALNETKVDRNIGDNLLNVEGYKMERVDRNKRGGGVAVYFKDSIYHSRRKDIPLDGREVVCIEIKPVKASPFIIIAWYPLPREPISTFEKFENILQFLENENKELILIADTNCNLLNQEHIQTFNDHLLPPHHLTGTANAHIIQGVHRHMTDLYDAYGLKQLIKVPSKETLQTTTLIDRIAVSEPRSIIDFSVLKIALHDHHMVYCIRKFRGALARQHKKILTRQMKNLDETCFLDDISSIDWNFLIESSTNLDSAVENWTNMFSLIIESMHLCVNAGCLKSTAHGLPQS